MIVCGFIGLTDFRMPVFLLLNISILFGDGIDFGRPLVAIIVSFIGLVVILVKVKTSPGLVECKEELVVILSSLSVVAEYFFISIRHWLKKNNRTNDFFCLNLFFLFYDFFCTIFTSVFILISLVFFLFFYQ
jgi:hypothetical protein